MAALFGQSSSDEARCTSFGPALAGSLHMLRRRSVVTLGLGAAVVLSLLSVCCAIGLFTTPWFMCELFAVQIALCTGKPVVRGLSFVPAGLVLLGAVLMVSAVAWITLLGTGPDLSAQSPRWIGFPSLMRSSGFFAAISSGSALLVIAPLLYAPLILIEQQTRYDVALVESVRLVVTRGLFASVRLSLGAHAVQVAPLLVATCIALIFEPTQLALFALCATPFLCASVPLGQGMIVWTYARIREELPSDAPNLSAEHQRELQSTLMHARIWMLLILFPLISLFLLQASLLRPSRIPPGRAPAGELMAVLHPNGTRPARVFLPNTALEIGVTSAELRVTASDGGGAGLLPLRAKAPISELRVVRVGDAYALELKQANRYFVSWVDRAGVRMDDDLRQRLMDLVSPWELLMLLLALLSIGLLTVPVLNDLGRVQRGYRMPESRRPSSDVLALDRRRSLSRARRYFAMLLPISLACIGIAARALGIF
jgi:hypothetical protein